MGGGVVVIFVCGTPSLLYFFFSLQHQNMVLGLFPFRLINSMGSGNGFSTTPVTTNLVSPPAYLADIMIQFSKQVIRPKVVLPMLLVIVLMFDLDDAFDIDDDYFEFENDDEEEN
ncbi:hypothetical protein BC941DRAFT_435125 [Chlamydoabsidia padenii]|nr:hypothetical protein BC941DRAFT_435125 [Chlamydoabsidia padenii]